MEKEIQQKWPDKSHGDRPTLTASVPSVKPEAGFTAAGETTDGVHTSRFTVD